MRKGLMTAGELSKRYRPSKAIELSIEKWERIGASEEWDNVHSGSILGYTCALCRKYFYKYGSCEGCPLIDCVRYNHPWKDASQAILMDDRKAFMKARKNILARLRRAYARGER